MLPGPVSYQHVSHQYGEPITINYLTKIGSIKHKFEQSWDNKLL